MAFTLLPSYMKIHCTQLTFLSPGLLLVTFSFDTCIKYCYFCFPMKSFGIQSPHGRPWHCLRLVLETMFSVFFLGLHFVFHSNY